ncbi:Immunoglobulin I-set domain protein [Anaerohalosphaera lusitana]|uniref:Immunoglobulin I-set domain protein n=2 Tax=Anaerohalosphaera lusitana TaxID=1936003 RepID=A0A1U9NNI8_9BACT|nr:Immunoglobulin I-set domain protein [Anaerohalosphaera lusitana]
MKKIRMLAILFGITAMLGTAQAGLFDPPVQNESFEQPALSPGGWFTGAQDWIYSGYIFTVYGGGYPEAVKGNQIIDGYGYTIAQQIGTYDPDTDLIVEAWYGSRNSSASDFTISLLTGPDYADANSVAATTITGNDTISQYIVELNTGTGGVAGEPLYLQVAVNGQFYSNIDYVQVFSKSPTSPVPANGANSVPVDQVFSWTSTIAGPNDTYDVYMTDADGTELIFRENVSTTEYAPASNLVENADYSWQVVRREPNSVEDILYPSSVWQFTTKSPATIVDDPADTLVDAGATATFSVTASAATSYQWKKDGIAISDTAGVYAGTNTDTLSVLDVQQDDEGSYTCYASNAYGGEESGAAILSIKRLKAHWDFEGDLTDEVEGIVCTPTGSPAFVTGVVGSSAISFDGSSFVVADIPTYFNFFDSGLTVNAWIKVSTDQSYKTYLAKDASYWMNASGDWSAFASTGAGALGASAGAGATEDNEWHLTTLTYDAPTTTFKYYFDGEFMGDFVTTPQTDNYNSPLTMGAASSAGAGKYTGLLDDVKIYNYPRTDAEIAQDYLGIMTTKVICVDSSLLTYDFNNDCEVNLADFAEFASQWLNCSRIAGVDSGFGSCN